MKYKIIKRTNALGESWYNLRLYWLGVFPYTYGFWNCIADCYVIRHFDSLDDVKLVLEDKIRDRKRNTTVSSEIVCLNENEKNLKDFSTDE